MEGSKFKTQQIRFEGGQLKLATEERSKDLKEGQVLIKVRYAPVTRFDKERLSVKPIPEKNVFGMEGCGIIEEVGPGVDQSLKGKKCAFRSGGWQQYTVQNAKGLLLFNDDVDLKKCASSMVNPMTALCIKYRLLDHGAKNFVVHGAATNLGRMFLRIAKREGLEGIAITKTEEEANALRKDLGLKNVFCHDGSDSFWKSYLSVVDEMKPRCLIDLCGSEWSGRLFSCMPPGSHLLLAGNVEGADLKISSKEFYMHNKQIRGFDLESYVRDELDEERRKHLFQIIQDDINSGGEYFGSEIGQEFKMDEWQQALTQVENLQEGKRILLNINA